MKKVLMSKVAILVYGLVLGVVFTQYIKPQDRYVKSFQRIQKNYATDPNEESKNTQNIINKIVKINESAKHYDWYPLLKERLLLNFPADKNAKVTVDINSGQFNINPGWKNDIKPTLVLENVRFEHLVRLEQILADRKLEESEMFEIANVFLVPGLTALYDADALYFPGDKRYLKLDNNIQVELVNKYNAKDLEGNLIESKATVLNVDGYWIVISGWQGEPDVKYAVDVNQMINYYYLINYKFREVKGVDLLRRKELLDEYMNLRKATQIYSKN